MSCKRDLDVKHLIDDDRLDILAPRQRAVCEAAIRGLTSTQISEEFGISPSSVRVTLRRVYQLLNVRNLIDLRSEFCQCMDVQEEKPFACETTLFPEVAERVWPYSVFADSLFLLSAGLLLFLLYFPVGPTHTDPKILDALRFGVPVGLIASCCLIPYLITILRGHRTAIIGCSMSLSSIINGFLITLSSFAIICSLRIQYASANMISFLVFASSTLIVALLFNILGRFAKPSSNSPLSRREGCILFFGAMALILLLRSCRYSGFAALALTVIVAILLNFHPGGSILHSGEDTTRFNVSHKRFLSTIRSNGLHGIQDSYSFLSFFVVGQLIMCLLDPHQDGVSPLLFLLAGLSLYCPPLICKPANVQDFGVVVLFGGISLFGYCLLGDVRFFYHMALTGGLFVLWGYNLSNLSGILSTYSSALGMLYQILLSAFNLHAIPSLDNVYRYGYRALAEFFISVGLSSIFVILLAVLSVAFVFKTLDANRNVECAEFFSCRETTSRLHAYCVFKGLNDLQINVVDACLAGKSVADTATSLNYSKAAVKAARSVAFKTFGVSSCRDLRNALIAILTQ